MDKANKQQNDISTLKTDVAVIKNDIKYIKKAINNLSFASQSDFDELKTDHYALKKEFQDFKDKHAIGTAFSDLFGNNALQYIIGGMLAIAAVVAAKLAGVKIL